MTTATMGTPECRALIAARAAALAPDLRRRVAHARELAALVAEQRADDERPRRPRRPVLARSRLTVRRPALAAMTRRAVPEPPFDLPPEEPIAAPAPPVVRPPDPAEQAEAEEHAQPLLTRTGLEAIKDAAQARRRPIGVAEGLEIALRAQDAEERARPPAAPLAHPKATPYPVGAEVEYRRGARAPWQRGAVVSDDGGARVLVQGSSGARTLPRRQVRPLKDPDRERQSRVLTQILDGPVRRAEDVRIVRTTGELVPVPKPAEPWRSEAYRAYVRTWPCASCRRADAQAHHHGPPGSRGVGMKCSDAFCIPLCAVCHEHWHAMRTLRERSELDAIGIRLLVAETQRDLLIDYFVSGLPSEEAAQ